MKQYIKNGEIKYAKNIVLKITNEEGKRMQVFNPTEEMILADGWEIYTPPTIEPTPRKKSRFEIIEELVTKQYNARTDIDNNEALEYMAIIYEWKEYLDKELTEGMIVIYEDKPWRVRQTHTVQSIYPPSLDTASLYEAIDKEHDGTLEDPIPYVAPMKIFKDKYYIEDGIRYICTRDSGTALTHNLNSLVGLYVAVA